jgi:hypothetical protein
LLHGRVTQRATASARLRLSRVAGQATGMDEREASRGTRSGRWARRVGGEAPMPALRPVVSSPPPSEPDVRLPPHPALHEHNERSLARAARVGFRVLAAVRRRCRYSPATSSHPLVPRAHWTPSPCGRLSRPPRWGVTPTATTGPPPRPGGHSGRCACPEPTNPGSAGTAGTLPTFTHTPVGRVGAQLYPGDVAAHHRNPARALTRPTS